MNEQFLREIIQKAQLKIEDPNFEQRLIIRIDLNGKARKRREWFILFLTTFGKVALMACILYYLKNIILPPGLKQMSFEKVYQLVNTPNAMGITYCLIGLTMGFLLKKALREQTVAN